MEPLHRFDVEAFRTLHVGLKSAPLDAVMWALSYSGLGQVQFLVVLVLLKWRGTRHFVPPLLWTIVAGGICAQAVKRLMPRDRPSNLFWSKPQEEFFANSFPSGHTTTAFAVATMLFLFTYGSSRAWIGWTALVWALLVGISRVYRGVHWPTDVLAGACAGAFAACVVYLIFQRMGRHLHVVLPDEPKAT